jgi:uncharacterized damage-inducible protein DinB
VERRDEVEALIDSVLDRLERIVGLLDGLTDAQLNWRPNAAGANSAYVLAAHTLGNARAWMLGIIGGQPLRRDRPAEFAASGADARALRTEQQSLATEVRRALAALAAGDLDRRLTPVQKLWGEGPARELSIREAFLHTIEHASLHLGHVQLTRDLARAAA